MAAPVRSFYSQLLQFTQIKDITNVKSLHSQIIKTGSTSCPYIANSLVNFYAKNQLLPEALQVFEEIENKDIVSWNCLINGYSQQGSQKGSLFAMALFKRMRAESVFPDDHTFAGVFTAASRLSDSDGGKQAHAVSIKLYRWSDVFVGSSLLNMFCKWGLVYDARLVFDEMPERNSVSWATMISGYSMQKLSGHAFELFRLLMANEKVFVNEFVMTSVLSAFALPEFIHIGKQIHGLIVKQGFSSHVSVGNAVVSMYAKCGSVDDSVQIFESASNKNSITWSAMITGYAQSGDCERALKLFSKMHFSGLKPSEFTLVGVLSACSNCLAVGEGKEVHGYLIKSGYESHIYMTTALIDMYAKGGCLDDAQKGFELLQEPDIVLWTSMIGGYVHNGENERGISLYCRMRMKGIVPSALTMVSVLKACSSLVALEQGKQIHATIIKHGFGLKVPIGSALLTMYAKSGSPKDGKIVFRRIPVKDVVSWNSMISGLAQNGFGDEALELFEEMQMEGTKPDHVTFVNILSTCSHMGLVERGWVYFKMMSSEFGIIPRIDHYACMVDLLSRSGKLNEAKKFIESASIDHGHCLWRILLSACCNHRNYDLGAHAGEKLMELGSLESSTYVLLSSIYKALGRSDDVERVRRTMNMRGVSKEPSCSWIELKSHAHVFVVGDQQHPQIKDQQHPQIKDIGSETQMLSNLMTDWIQNFQASKADVAKLE